MGTENLELSDDDDLFAVATKVARKPSTRISRIANEQLKLSRDYYNNASQQSKRSFQIALILSIVGGVIFFLTIAVTVIAEVFHFQNNQYLLPGGTILSIISEGLAGLNFLYDRATKQFMLFQGFLDRILRASIAQAIAEEIKDDQQRQNAVERIIDNLLKHDGNNQSKDTKPSDSK